MPFENMDSEELRDLLIGGLESGRAATLKFFRKKLKAVCRSNPRFSDDQIDYIASMLSEFALKAIQENCLAADQLLKIKETYQLLSSGDIKGAGVLSPSQIEEMACQILFLSSFDEKTF